MHGQARRAEAGLIGGAARRRDPPTRGGGGGLYARRIAPGSEQCPAQHEARRAEALAGQLQAPAFRQIDLFEFPENDSDATRAQRVLLHREHVRIAVDAHEDDARGIEAEALQAGRVRIVAPERPDHHAAAGDARCEACCEARHGGGRLTLQPIPADLVPMAKLKPAER